MNTNARVAAIFSELHKIAEQFGEMAEANAANWDNPLFVQKMKRHEELTTEARTLLSGSQE